MITIENGNSLQGSSSVASAVSYTIEGMELTIATGATAYEVLATQTYLNSPGAASMYAPGVGVAGFIKSMFFTNNGASPATVVLYIGGTAAGNQIYRGSIPVGGTLTYTSNGGWTVYDANGLCTRGTRGFPVIVPIGNTSSNTASISSGTLNLFGGNFVTLNQNANTITINTPATPTVSYFDNMCTGVATVSYALPFLSLHIFPLINNDVFIGNMTPSSCYFDMTGTVVTSASNTLSAASIMLRVGIYSYNTQSNVLSLATSGSCYLFSTGGNFDITAAGSNQCMGQRWAMLTQNNWAGGANPQFTAGHYWVGWNAAVTYNNNNSSVLQGSLASFSFSIYGQSGFASVARMGTMNSAYNTNSTGSLQSIRGNQLIQGYYTTTINSLPDIINLQEISKQSAQAYFVPHFIMNALTGDF